MREWWCVTKPEASSQSFPILSTVRALYSSKTIRVCTSLKSTGAGCPHVLQDELARKMTGLAEQGALAGTHEKKEGLPPMEERAGDSRGVQGSP